MVTTTKKGEYTSRYAASNKKCYYVMNYELPCDKFEMYTSLIIYAFDIN